MKVLVSSSRNFSENVPPNTEDLSLKFDFWMFKCNLWIFCAGVEIKTVASLEFLPVQKNFLLTRHIDHETEFIINKRWPHCRCLSVIEPPWHLFNPNFISNMDDITSFASLFLDSTTMTFLSKKQWFSSYFYWLIVTQEPFKNIKVPLVCPKSGNFETPDTLSTNSISVRHSLMVWRLCSTFVLSTNLWNFVALSVEAILNNMKSDWICLPKLCKSIIKTDVTTGIIGSYQRVNGLSKQFVAVMSKLNC